MAEVFISYRREDTRHLSARIYDQLTSHYGQGRVFFDVDTLPRYAGWAFADVIHATVPQCPVFLAVIGTHWARLMEARKQDAEDWVQVEIRMALNTPGVRVVPVLVDGAAMPKADQLPVDLRPLLARQAITLPQDPHFREGVNELAKTLLAGRGQETNASTTPPASDVEGNWAEIELSLDATRYRRFEKMFEAIPAAFRRVNEAEDRAKTLERWALVDKTDPAAIAEFLRKPLFPALQNAAQSAMHEAAQAQAAREAAARRNQHRKEAAEAAAAREAAQAAREEAARLAQQQQEAAAAQAAREEAARLAQLRRQEALGQGLRTWAIPAGAAGLALVLLLIWSPWHASPPSPAGEEASISEPVGAMNASPLSPAAPASSPVNGGAQIHAPPLAAGQTFRECENCPEMVVIPAGSFLMGSPDSEPDRDSDEGPQRRVTISQPFAVGRFEVTFDEWAACVAGGGCRSNANPGDAGWGRGRRPVINVSWNDAQEYVRWLSQKTGQRYRLLTEAEWEYAARAGATTRWSFGDDESQLGTYAWFTSNSNDRTQPVGGKTANRFGLYDVHGNVWEWVEDCYADTYSSLATNGAANTTQGCSVRVNRGGSWFSSAQYLRSADRGGDSPSLRGSGLGFRVARTL